MAENNLDKALAYLGTTLQTLVQQANDPVDLEHLHTKIAKRSLTGDHINGGTIINFASSGIKDTASEQQLTVDNSGVSVKNAQVENSFTAKSAVIEYLEVKELKAPNLASASLELTVSNGETLVGKGVMLKGHGTTKQLIFTESPDKFTSTEHIELIKDREFRIDGNPVLTATGLGAGVVTSNLRQVGRLRGLLVDGVVNIDNYIIYNNVNNRLGIGTDEPNAGLSICEEGIEVVVGTKDNSKGMIGTFASQGFDIVTDNTSRVSISSNGNILLGNYGEGHVQVNVHGSLAVKVKNADPTVDLHVAGPIKFSDRVHQYGNSSPESGTYSRGSIVWNSEADIGKPVGWICVRAGSPGAWLPFGDVKQSG